MSPLTGQLEPIGEGRVDLRSALDQLNAHKTLTIELTNAAQQPAGLVLVGATLLDRPVGTRVSYPATTAGTPFSPMPVSKPHASRTKNGVFKVERVVCHEMTPPFTKKTANSANPPPKGDYYVVVQVGQESLRTDPVECKTTQNTLYAAYECPDMVFDVEYEQLPSETIKVDVFEVSAKAPNGKRLVGRAKAPLYSMVVHNDGDDTPATEFAMQLKDQNDVPAGKVSLFLLLHKENVGFTEENGRSLFDSPAKSARSPGKVSRNTVGMSPRLNNILVPANFQTGWIRISSIQATNLNKFRLVGNTARYKHLREDPATPVPAYLKHSELRGRQDPFVVVEAGEFWGSYSKVLLNQGYNCQWDQAAFCCYLSNLDASEQNMKVSVYDRSCSGFHNVFIGFATVPLVNFFAPQRTKDCALELNVVDRRGKANGKLELKYTWEASDEKERWSNGIITKVLGDGCYNVRYDDGEEEFGVSKDVIRLLSRSATNMPPLPPGRRALGSSLFAIKEGNRVEVNDQGKGLWYPAWVVRIHQDGTYDIDSDYEVAKQNVLLDHLRLADGPSPKHNESSNSLVSRRLSYEESSVVSGAGCKAKYSLRQQVEGNYKCKNTWYVGKIFKVHHYEMYCTYDIDYLTGEFESEVAEDMIRVESARAVPEDATSAYELRALRAQRPESSVLPVPQPRTTALTTAPGRTAQGTTRTKSKYQAGEDVEVNYRGHGIFYAASIEADYENGSYDILYNTTGERDLEISEDLIRAPVDPDAARLARNNSGIPNKYKFEVGDRVEANFREIGKYIPGIITRDRGHGVFDVQYYDGRTESRVNFELIRMADPNAIFAPAQRPAKFAVGDSVESNCEGLGVWYHALVRNVLPDGLYNIQYDDGETEYDVNEEQLRVGGAYSPGIPSLKPFFRVNDRVRVACRSIDVEHELRSLSAIKQRIMEERKKLAEGKLAVAKRAALFDASKEAAESAHRGLQGFKTHVGYSGDLNCCQAESPSGEDASTSPATDVSPTSFKKLDEIEDAFNPSDETKETDTVETLNDAVTKAIVVEQSLGHIAGAAKDEELAKAENAHKLALKEKEKADELALSRAIDEGRARKRNNFSREEELRVFKEIYQKAELELGHVMAARQLVLEHDEALKVAKQKADLEAKCIAGAQAKGEKATIRIRAEDRDRLAAAELAAKGDTRTSKKAIVHNSKKEKTPSQKVQKSLGPDVASERDALRLALIRVKRANEDLLAAKARAELAGKDYAAAESRAEVSSKDLNALLESNRKAEQTLTEDSMLAKKFREYMKASDAVSSYLTMANSKAALKMTDERKAEAATALRRRMEEGAAVSGEKRILAEESMIRNARNGDFQSAKNAIREANGHADKQGDEVVEAVLACDAETKALITATSFAEEENKHYVSAKEIAVLAAGLLRVIIADQRDREYSQLGQAKQKTAEMMAELAKIRQQIAARDQRRVSTTAAAETEAQAITHIKTRVSTVRNTELHTSTVEKTALSLKVLQSQNGRAEAELEMTRVSKTRIALEERATASYERCESEETVATSCAAENGDREQGATYSAEECEAVRNATLHALQQYDFLQEAKTLALRELETIDACRACAEEEFEALSSLSGVERSDLTLLVGAKPLPQLQENLALSRAEAIDATRALHMARLRAKDLRKDLAISKDSTSAVLEELSKAQSVTQYLTVKDFALDRNKVSVVEGAQNSVRAALTTAVTAEKDRMDAEESAEHAMKNSEEASHRASAADRLCLREEEASRLAAIPRGGISMTADEHEVQVTLIAAITHSAAQVEALHQAVAFAEQEVESLTTAKAQSIIERKSLLLALSKEEKILLIKAQRDQEKSDAELATAKRMLDLRIALSNDALMTLEREALALDVAIAALERAAKELVTRGDDDILEFRAYQKEFKRLMCKRQKAAEARKRNLATQAKTEVTSMAREAEEESAIATESKFYPLEKQAALAEQENNAEDEIKALRAARALVDECTLALEAAGEYASAEDSLYETVHNETEDERRALFAARDHAEESHRLLMKALSVLPLQHRTCMGLMLLNGGHPFFKGVPVRPRKMDDKNGDRKVDPSDLLLAQSAFDDVCGNVDQRAADFKDDIVIPDQDSKEMNWQFDANPLRAALRAALEEVDSAHDLLNSAKGRTDDAENRYHQASAIATAEGEAVVAQEEQNAATSYRLYDNFVGVEEEMAQLQKVRIELGYEDKTTANLRSAKEAEVKKVPPLTVNRQRNEEIAAEAAQNRAASVEKAVQARVSKDPKRMDAALKEAKKFCEAEVSALNDAVQYAAKECAVWTNGTGVANKETVSAEKAHVLADEEARLLELIRAAQLGQGQDAYRAAKKQAENAKDQHDDAERSMAGFSDLIEELRANNVEREADLTEESKNTPEYRPYLEVRTKFDTESKRAQAAHANHEQEVAKALKAGELKELGGAEAASSESKRLEEENLADDAAAAGDKQGERDHSDKAKEHEAAVTAAYQRGTQAGLTEAAHWKAAEQWLVSEKEALTAAHGISLDATDMLVQMREDQIKRELMALQHANQVNLDCANAYEVARRRAVLASNVLAKSRALLTSREAVFGDEIKNIPNYDMYTELVNSLMNADEQANLCEEEKLKERAEVDNAIAAKQKEEKTSAAAGAQRVAAVEAVRTAQMNNDPDAEMYAMDDLKKHCDDEENALLAAREHAANEASKWAIATDLANEEANSRIIAKDHCNNAIRMLNALRLDKEQVDLDTKRGEAVDAEAAYYATRKALLDAREKTAELVEKSQISPDAVSPEVKETPAYDSYVIRASALAADAKRPTVDHDAINAPAIAGAKAAAESRRVEESTACQEQELRTPAERATLEYQRLGELERESKALVESNAHLDAEEMCLLKATRFAEEEIRIWKSLKSLADGELRAATDLNDRAEETGKMLGDLVLNEKERLAAAIAAATERAVNAENEYHVTNKKTLARMATLKATITKTENCAKALPESHRTTPEFDMYTVQLGLYPAVDEEAQAVKKTKEEFVTAAEDAKQQRQLLEVSKRSSIRALKPRTSVLDMAAKLDKETTKNPKKADLSETETSAMALLLATAEEEAAAWTSATTCTKEEKVLYTEAVDIFEQGLLLLAAAKVNQRERDILAKLTKAEEAAAVAKAEYYAVCEKIDAQQQELSNRLVSNSGLEAEVVSQDPDALSAALFVRAKERLQKEEARAAAAREARTSVEEKAGALFASRQTEISTADDCVHKMNRVLVLDTAAPHSSTEQGHQLSAVTRLDVVYWEVNSKVRSPTGVEDVRDEQLPVLKSITDGSTATYKDLRGVYVDFGAGKRDKVSANANMAALHEEQVYAGAEERALGAATNHAIDEEQTWRLALKHAVIEADALADACTKADEASRALLGVKDNINEHQKSMLDSADADAKADADRFAHKDRECAELSSVFEQKKAQISAKDAALDNECRDYDNYHVFEGVNADLKDNREPAIIAARQAKFAAAARANGWGAQKVRDLEEAATAEKGGREPQMQQARASALDSVQKESAAWVETEKCAAEELAALTQGVKQQDEALRLLDLVKAEFEDDSADVAAREAEGSRQKFGLTFEEAERKHKIFSEKMDVLSTKDAELLPETKELPVYKKYYKLYSELQNDDEPFIVTRRGLRVGAADEAEALVIANKKIKPSVASAQSEQAAWEKAGYLGNDEVSALDTGIAKSDEAIALLDATKLEQLKRQGNADEKDLWDSKSRSAEAQAALAATEAKIKAARGDLDSRKADNIAKGEKLAQRGPEFASQVNAHKEFLLQVDSTLAQADSHRWEKELDIEKAVAANQAVQEEENTAAAQDSTEEGATRRRDALVAANEYAEAERVHYEDATEDAEAELSALQLAATTLKEDDDALEEAQATRAYRTRFGYIMLGGDDDGLIKIPKSRPFNNISFPTAPKFIDATKMKSMANHSDFEPIRERRKANTQSESDDSTLYGDDSRPTKVLFELGGGWTSALLAMTKKLTPYQPGKPEEFLPPILVTSDISKTPGRASARKVQAPASFYTPSADGTVSHHRLRGKALFKAAVLHLIRIHSVVRQMKPLGDGELEKLKERIDASTGMVESTSHFLEDDTVLSSRAGRSLVHHHGSPVRGDGTDDSRSGSPSRFASTALISSNIAKFMAGLQRRSTSMDDLTSSTVTTTTEGGARNKFRGAAKKVISTNRANSAFRSVAGAETSNFKKSEPVNNDSIMSFLFGGPAKTVDVAVLEEEEDVVEHVKETTKETTQSTEKRQEQTVENFTSEESEVVEMTSSTRALSNNSSPQLQQGSSKQPKQQQQAQQQQSPPAKTERVVSDDAADWDDDGDFGTAYEEME